MPFSEYNPLKGTLDDMLIDVLLHLRNDKFTDRDAQLVSDLVFEAQEKARAIREAKFSAELNISYELDQQVFMIAADVEDIVDHYAKTQEHYGSGMLRTNFFPKNTLLEIKPGNYHNVFSGTSSMQQQVPNDLCTWVLDGAGVELGRLFDGPVVTLEGIQKIAGFLQAIQAQPGMKSRKGHAHQYSVDLVRRVFQSMRPEMEWLIALIGYFELYSEHHSQIDHALWYIFWQLSEFTPFNFDGVELPNGYVVNIKNSKDNIRPQIIPWQTFIDRYL